MTGSLLCQFDYLKIITIQDYRLGVCYTIQITSYHPNPVLRMKQYSFFIPARHEQKIFLNTFKCMQHRFVIKLCCQ